MLLGIGIGGDYPLSAIITSEFANKKWRGAMISAVFAMQGFGILAACFVTLIFLAAFKSLIIGNIDNLDIVWRLCLGFGCLPALFAIYFRLTIPETPRYTIEINNDINKAVNDVDCVIDHERKKNLNSKKNNENKATLRETYDHFKKWKNFKVLLGTSLTWFALDVAFYGINLNTSIIIQAIGFSGNLNPPRYVNDSFGNLSMVNRNAEIYNVLFNNVVGNIIVA